MDALYQKRITLRNEVDLGEAEEEKEIREAFDRTVAVRGKGPKEKELADRYFFEKVHEGVHKQFTEARERSAHAKDSVEAVRATVQSYAPYLHFVERLYNDAVLPISHGVGEGGHTGASVPSEPRVH